MKISYDHYLNKENSNFTLVRLTCCLLVIYGHSLSLIPTSNNPDIIKQITGLPAAYIGVKSFFFLSGLLCVNSLLKKQNLRQYVVRRFFRIYPPLIFTILFSALIIGPVCTNETIQSYFSSGELIKYIKDNLLLKTWGNNNIGLPGVFINNKYPIAVNSPLWTIHVEIIVYCILFALCAISGGGTGFKISIGIIAVISIIDIFLPESVIYPFLPRTDSNFNNIQLCYAIGLLIAISQDRIVINWKTSLGFFILYLIFKSTIFNTVLLFVVIFTIVINISKSRVSLKLKSWPDLSFGIYLFAWPIQQTVVHLFPSLNYVISLLLTVSISTGMAYISYRLIEIPSLKLEKRIVAFLTKNKKEKVIFGKNKDI